MQNKLIKISAGLGTLATALYWSVIPVVAGNQTSVNLCLSNVGGSSLPGCSGADLGKIIQSAISILLFVAFIAALVFLVFGGIKWIMSAGDKEGAGKAKETVTSALIGLAIVLGSWILVNVVVQLITGNPLGTLNIPTLNIN